MSGHVHRAPRALASDGTVLVNAAEFDGPLTLAAVVKRARALRGKVFVGVAVTPRERRRAMMFVSSGMLFVGRYFSIGALGFAARWRSPPWREAAGGRWPCWRSWKPGPLSA